MTTNFPTSLQDLDATRGTSGQPLSTPNHITHHTTEDDTIEALQAKVGVDNSAVATSLDYLVKNTSSSNPGHKHTLANGATDVTASASELNILDGATLTVTELNYVDGVTSSIQTQLNNKAEDSAVVHDTGNESIDGIKTFTSDPIIPDEAYGSGWNGVLEPPTKNAVYDKIETIAPDFFMGSGVATATKTYWNFNIPLLVTTNVPSGDIWTMGSNTTFSAWTLNSASLDLGADNNSATLTTGGIFTETGFTSTVLEFDTTQKVIVEFGVQLKGTGTEQQGFGLTSGGIGLYDYDDQTVDTAAFTIDASGNLYGKTGNAGSGHTETAISGITLTNMNTYRIEFDPGVDVKFYVNGVLKATNTTNLPDGANDIKFGWGFEGNTNNNDRMMVTTPYFAIEK